MSTEPKLGTCDNVRTLHRHNGYTSIDPCVGWREVESAPAQPTITLSQGGPTMPSGLAWLQGNKTEPLLSSPQAEAVPPAAGTAAHVSLTRAGLRIVGEQLDRIPLKHAEGWNRHNTDCQRVLHIWADGKSYDITVPKEEFLGDE